MMSFCVFSMLINEKGKRRQNGMHALALGIENYDFRVDFS